MHKKMCRVCRLTEMGKRTKNGRLSGNLQKSARVTSIIKHLGSVTQKVAAMPKNR